jgi:hypothetical protein
MRRRGYELGERDTGRDMDVERVLKEEWRRHRYWMGPEPLWGLELRFRQPRLTQLKPRLQVVLSLASSPPSTPLLLLRLGLGSGIEQALAKRPFES